ncbi:hypothetical protein FP026_13080 [Rhizobium tropici]|uniref:Uncharacterized protein n=1 Tax=Rhizobium tropici TaxID=398 RepID=A0A5B0W2L8_RHITR|nr:hypothetical protein FP026_13080 [Rhizobium tropici]
MKRTSRCTETGRHFQAVCSFEPCEPLGPFRFSPNRENALSFCCYAIPDGKPLRTFPGIALVARQKIPFRMFPFECRLLEHLFGCGRCVGKCRPRWIAHQKSQRSPRSLALILRNPQGAVRAVQLFRESPNRSISLFSRNSGRKPLRTFLGTA